MEALWKKRKTRRKQVSSLELSEYVHFPHFTHRQIREAIGNFLYLIRHNSSWMEYKGCMLGGSEFVAVKCFRTNLEERVREEFFNKIIALSKIKHINIVSILGYCSTNQEMILVHEYMSFGTLAENIYEVSGAPRSLTWEQRLRICIGAARGLDCLHSCGIVHRDVKCSNILLDKHMLAKVADIGFSRMVGESDSYDTTRIVGTYGYLDPAYFMTNMLTKKSDVYSFGIVMLVVLCGKSPFIKVESEETDLTLVQYFRGRDSDEDIVDPNLKGSITSESLKEFVNSLEKCLEHIQEKRPSMSQLVVSLENALEKQRYTTIMSSASESESDTLEEEEQQGNQPQPSSSTALQETAFLSSLSGPF